MIVFAPGMAGAQLPHGLRPLRLLNEVPSRRTKVADGRRAPQRDGKPSTCGVDVGQEKAGGARCCAIRTEDRP
jgi:hypothetical protein